MSSPREELLLVSVEKVELAELAATIPPHIRHVEVVAKRLRGPARVALERYVAAALEAQVALQRERLGVRHG